MLKTEKKIPENLDSTPSTPPTTEPNPEAKITFQEVRETLQGFAGQWYREHTAHWPWEKSKNASPPEESCVEEKNKQEDPNTTTSLGDKHLDNARQTLRDLLSDIQLPEDIRQSLKQEFHDIHAMLDKVEHGHLHIAVFGRVGVGKSALLNALLGEYRFKSSPLHGETKQAEVAAWQEQEIGGLFLIDTPGINEIDGESRENLAHQVAQRADLVLFVSEGDLSETELDALETLEESHRPVVLVFNKSDRYTRKEKELLVAALKRRTAGLVPPEHIVLASAYPSPRVYIHIDEHGKEVEETRTPDPEVELLRETLWQILKSEGKTLSALNATLFASRFSQNISQQVVEIKKDIAEKVVHRYCVIKGVAVAFNPIPVVDLVSAVAVDTSLIIHLSKLYGLPIHSGEAGELIRVIMTQMALVMGTAWAVNLIASTLKVASFGLSTIITGAAQGGVAYYATYVVGKSAQHYFEQGKSWGEHGPKKAVQDILNSLDRESLLSNAREEIFSWLKKEKR